FGAFPDQRHPAKKVRGAPAVFEPRHPLQECGSRRITVWVLSRRSVPCTSLSLHDRLSHVPRGRRSPRCTATAPKRPRLPFPALRVISGRNPITRKDHGAQSQRRGRRGEQSRPSAARPRHLRFHARPELPRSEFPGSTDGWKPETISPPVERIEGKTVRSRTLSSLALACAMIVTP